MKMAKPGEGQFDAVFAFLRMMEGIIEKDVYPTDEDAEEEKPVTDDPAATLGFIIRQWPDIAPHWQRVLFAGQTCIENACDPNAATLEFKPEIALAIEEHPKLKAMNAEMLAEIARLNAALEKMVADADEEIARLEKIISDARI
jgi:hypothetical protein